jgi:hypothetical protein
MHACTCRQCTHARAVMLTYADVSSILHREIETKRGREERERWERKREREREEVMEGGSGIKSPLCRRVHGCTRATAAPDSRFWDWLLRSVWFLWPLRGHWQLRDFSECFRYCSWCLRTLAGGNVYEFTTLPAGVSICTFVLVLSSELSVYLLY